MDFYDFFTASGVAAWVFALHQLVKVARRVIRRASDLPRRLRWALLGPHSTQVRNQPYVRPK